LPLFVLIVLAVAAAFAATTLALAIVGVPDFRVWTTIACLLAAIIVGGYFYFGSLGSILITGLVALVLPYGASMALTDLLLRKGRGRFGEWFAETEVFDWWSSGWIEMILLVLALPFQIASAFRLAQPDSWWADRFYDETKRQRAIARYGSWGMSVRGRDARSGPPSERRP